jgi:FkbM family methyltransferase
MAFMRSLRTLEAAARAVGASYLHDGAPTLSGRKWRTRYALARLGQLTPHSAGVAHLGDLDLRYTHPQSLVAQYRAIFQNECYRFDLDADRVRPLIVDCGANIGIATLYWKLLYPQARIVAFEPDPEIAIALRSNIALARVNVEIIEAAVWTQSGQERFSRLGAGAGRFGDGEPVPTVRLLDYLGDHVDFLKIDIEGAEVDVLADCEQALSYVDRLFVEYHAFSGQAQRLDVLISLLTRAGYRLYIQSEFCPCPPFTSEEQHLGMDLQLNIYARRPS